MANEPLTLPPGHKICRPPRAGGGCGRALPHSRFRPQASNLDGYQHECRDCQNAKRRANRAKNGEAIRAAEREARVADPEKYREYRRKWRRQNPERAAELDARYRDENRPAIRARERERRQAARAKKRKSRAGA
jgi:hypothetical protein